MGIVVTAAQGSTPNNGTISQPIDVHEVRKAHALGAEKSQLPEKVQAALQEYENAKTLNQKVAGISKVIISLKDLNGDLRWEALKQFQTGCNKSILSAWIEVNPNANPIDVRTKALEIFGKDAIKKEIGPIFEAYMTKFFNRAATTDKTSLNSAIESVKKDDGKYALYAEAYKACVNGYKEQVKGDPTLDPKLRGFTDSLTVAIETVTK